MQEETELSEIIGEIYGAALDPAMWPAVIEKVVVFCEGQAGCIIIRDLARQTTVIEYSVGCPAGNYPKNIHRHLRFSVVDTVLSSADIGDVIRISDLTGASKFNRSRYYRNWLMPNGWSDLLLAPISKCGNTYLVIAITGGNRRKTDDCDPIQLVAPHLEQAFKISRPLMARETQLASFEAALDRLKPGIFLLDRKGSVVQANRGGETMLKEAHVLHMPGGELRFRDAAADQLMRGAIAAAREDSPRNDLPAVGTQMILQNGERYIARLLPLQKRPQKSNGVGTTAVLALFVYEAELETTSPLRLIADAYKLTPAEMRVFLAIVQIGGVPEAAEGLGIARNTMRALLQRVYNKTGINRQADLAKLLASFSTPLV
jgi:DNA-binding CsgD family transcriptional regulator